MVEYVLSGVYRILPVNYMLTSIINTLDYCIYEEDVANLLECSNVSGYCNLQHANKKNNSATWYCKCTEGLWKSAYMLSVRNNISLNLLAIRQEMPEKHRNTCPWGPQVTKCWTLICFIVWLVFPNVTSLTYYCSHL